MAGAEAKKLFIEQPINEFLKSVEEDLKNGKYDVVKGGITIANDIMTEFITTPARRQIPRTCSP